MSSPKNLEYKKTSFLSKSNSSFIEEMYIKYIEKFKSESIKAIALIRAYRIRGHLIANLDPLGIMERKYLHELHPADPVSYTHLTLPTILLV